MSNTEVVSKLEALLARVRTRAAEPRRRVAAEAAPPPPAPAPAYPATEPSMRAAAVSVPEPPRPPAPAAAPPAAAPPLVLDEEVTLAQPKPPRVSEVDIVVDVDVQEATLDKVVVPTEEPVVPAAAESRERLVAAEPLPADVVAEAAAPAEELPSKLETLPPAEVGATEEPAEPEEEHERAPISSRRPVAPEPEERLAQMAFGSDEPAPPPLHTPPPESGRLPAAPLVDFDGDTTGVRDAQPIVQAAALTPPPVRALVPDVTRPTIAPASDVVDVVGEAQRFAPTTFVELLDASLAL